MPNADSLISKIVTNDTTFKKRKKNQQETILIIVGSVHINPCFVFSFFISFIQINKQNKFGYWHNLS